MKFVFFFLLALWGACLSGQQSPDFSSDCYHLPGSVWTGIVDTIRASKTDTIWTASGKVASTSRRFKVYPNVQFRIAFVNDISYHLSADLPVERALLNQYLKRFNLVKYVVWKTDDGPNVFGIRVENKEKTTSEARNYGGQMKFIDCNTIELTVSLDDRTKTKTLILRRM